MRSQTRSANHHMSCRRSRKILCDPGNPLYKMLQVCTVAHIGHQYNFFQFKSTTQIFLLQKSELYNLSGRFELKKIILMSYMGHCTLVTRSSLHVASIEGKIERICLSGVNTGLSE